MRPGQPWVEAAASIRSQIKAELESALKIHCRRAERQPWRIDEEAILDAHLDDADFERFGGKRSRIDELRVVAVADIKGSSGFEGLGGIARVQDVKSQSELKSHM
eukprot:Gb_01908 [translate_table: standard]